MLTDHTKAKRRQIDLQYLQLQTFEQLKSQTLVIGHSAHKIKKVNYAHRVIESSYIF